jgi:hypothetical protein
LFVIIEYAYKEAYSEMVSYRDEPTISAFTIHLLVISKKPLTDLE